MINKNQISDLTNHSFIDDNDYSNAKGKAAQWLEDKKKEAQAKLDDAKKRLRDAEDRLKSAGKNASDTLKKDLDNAKKGLNNAESKVKEAGKKAINRIKAASKKVRDGIRGGIRKALLFKISNNIYFIATRLYPAIAPNDVSKYKKSYLNVSKKHYKAVLKEWEGLNGKEADLKNAIILGHNKFKGGKKSGFDGTEYYSSNVFADGYYYNADGDTSSTDTSPEDTIPTEATDADTQKGLMGIIARILAIFRGTPKEDVSSDPSVTDPTDPATDPAPDPSEAQNDVVKGLDSDNQILGVDKTTFWVGAAIGTVVLVGGFFGIRHMMKSKGAGTPPLNN